MTERWDVFCRVVDHYGDVGIAWRLARQLAVDAQRSVRLVVDGLDALARIAPPIDPRAARQRVECIDVIAWSSFAAHEIRGAAVVVELLGCGLDDVWLDAMRSIDDGGPVWIDFEHLSAERWVADFHGLPSPHPSRPLVKHFYFPGFDASTGGLWLEPGLEVRRRAFVDDAAAIDATWDRFGLTPRVAGERRVSLFAYPTAPVGALLRAMRRDANRRWTVLVPEGVATDAVPDSVASPDRSTDVHPIPFAGQDDYDRLLWACDVNFVRGEDSFVRAQAAARPFVWQAYRQPDDAHLAKVAAFAERHDAGLDAPARAAQRDFWRAWNANPGTLPDAFDRWADALPALQHHAARWSARLAADEPLVDRLVAFARARMRSGLLD